MLVIAVAGNARAQTVLIVQDNTPWGYTYWYDHLATAGLGYTVVGSPDIPTVNLAAYDLVIVPSQQPTDFNVLMDTHMDRFEDYVDGGGKLILMRGTYLAYTAIETLPCGAWHEHHAGTGGSCGDNMDPTHPIMLGVPAYSCEFSSHG